VRDRLARTGGEADLEEAIRVYQQAVKATPPDSPDLPMYLSNLGSGLLTRFGRTGREADLEEAIVVYQQAVKATTPDSPDLPSRLNNLGTGLRTRFGRTGREADLEEAIRVYQRAVKATPPDSPAMPSCLNNLGNGLGERYERTGREADLEESIRVLQQAVQATPPDSPDLPSRLNNLGTGLLTRFGRTGREADLEDSIRAYQRAVKATPPDSPDLPSRLNSLGNGLREQFRRTGREAVLEESIRVLQQAVKATPPDSPDLPMILSNLGDGLRNRFGRTRREADLEEAIRVYQQAVKATPPESPALPAYLNNLGNGLNDRFGRTGREADLEEAIRVYQQAVKATPPDSPDLPMLFGNLGNGLSQRFAHTGREADLEEAIRVSQQAVKATPPESPDLPGHLTNLGTGLSARFAHTGQEADLEEAIRVFRRACELGALSAPQAALAAARNWGRWAVQSKQWSETAEAYGYGLATGRQLLARQLQRAHKESCLRDLQEMSGPAAYALAKLARYEEAAAVMERGRARLLAESLQRRRRDLEHLTARGHEELYRRYREMVERQERLTQPATAPADQPDSLRGQARLDAIIAANLAFDKVVADIQKVPGYADFLAEPTFAQIQAVAQDTPVAYLLATSAGGLALLVHGDEVQPVWLDTLTNGTVREWLRGPADDRAMGGWLGAYQNRLLENTPQAQRAWLAAIDDVTHRLWAHIMEPLAAALHQRLPGQPSAAPAVTLIPAGLLALLPLHAAWTEDASTPTQRRYFLDEFTVNYAPSALALRHARDGAERARGDRLLAVEEPLAAGASRLPNVHAEVAAIAGLFDTPVILARAEATRRAVRAVLPEAHIVHFSCHGSNDWQSPLESGLLMADDETGKDVLLTVRDLLESGQVGGRLVTLSACETGIVGTDLPDEVVALPSALLQAGYGGVAASLWSVSDISTAPC
jgi:CHAT domain-containing protein/tetratricopeptide (TPR) repeat protein